MIRSVPFALSGENKMATVTIEENVLLSILATVGSKAPETGGVLGADVKKNPFHICHFEYCLPAKKSGKLDSGSTFYSPDAHEMNRIIDDLWAPAGYWFCGIIHSHPRGCKTLSHGENKVGDLAFFSNMFITAQEEFEEFGVSTIIAPILTFDKQYPEITVWLINKKAPFEPYLADFKVVGKNKNDINVNEYIRAVIDKKIIVSNRVESIEKENGKNRSEAKLVSLDELQNHYTSELKRNNDILLKGFRQSYRVMALCLCMTMLYFPFIHFIYVNNNQVEPIKIVENPVLRGNLRSKDSDQDVENNIVLFNYKNYLGKEYVQKQ